MIHSIFLIIAIFILVFPSLLAGEGTEEISKRLLTLNQQITDRTKELQQEKKKNEDLLVKSRQSSDALKDAYISAERMTIINSKLNEFHEQHSNLCKEWKVAYAEAVDALLLQAQNETSPKRKGELGKKLQELQKQNVRLCPVHARVSVSQEWRSVRVEPYDGPQEIKQKMELLEEISREIQIQLTSLDKQLQDFKKERKTKERAEEFIQESTLFTDNVSVRRGNTIETSTAGSNGELDKNRSGTEIISRGELYGKEQQEQFELQYEQKKKQLLSQQKELSQKLQELKTRAQNLKIQ